MSTTSLTSAERFDAEYPEELGDRLAWLERRCASPGAASCG
jgi:hypothetical protein